MNAFPAGNCDVISTANPFPDTAKFMFFGVEILKPQQVRCWKINRKRTQCCPWNEHGA